MNLGRRRDSVLGRLFRKRTCSRVRAMIVPFLDGEASPAEAREVLAHTAECAPCAEELASQRLLSEALPRALSMPVRSRLTAQAVREAARLEGPRRVPEEIRSRAFAGPRRAWAFAAAAAVLVGAGLFFLSRGPERSNPSDPTANDEILAHLEVLEALEEEGLEPTPELVQLVVEVAARSSESLEGDLLDLGIFDLILEEELAGENL